MVERVIKRQVKYNYMRGDLKRKEVDRPDRQLAVSVQRGVDQSPNPKPKELAQKLIHSRQSQKEVALSLTIDSQGFQNGSQGTGRQTSNRFTINRDTVNAQQMQNALFLHKFDEYFAQSESTLYSEFKSIFQPMRIQEMKIPLVQNEERRNHRQLRSSFKRKIEDRPIVMYIEPNILKLKLKKVELLEDYHNEEMSERGERVGQSKNLKSSRTHSLQKPPFASPLKSKGRREAARADILERVNPNRRDTFTYDDLYASLLYLNGVQRQDDAKQNADYYKVYVEDGNNGDLVRAIVGRRAGWRVVELPSIANFVWTQAYRPFHRTLYHLPKDTAVIPHLPLDSLSPSLTAPSEDAFIKELRRLIPLTSTIEDYSFPHHSLPATCSPRKERRQDETIVLESNDIMQRSVKKEVAALYFGHSSVVHNHFPNHRCITDKKNLLDNLSRYYRSLNKQPFDYVPESYNVTALLASDQVQISLSVHPEAPCDLEQALTEGTWIVKPAESSNRGKGIIVCQNRAEVLHFIVNKFYKPKDNEEEKGQKKQQTKQEKKQEKKQFSGMKKARFVVQRYINPLLYEGRKFDIRAYLLVTMMNGVVPRRDKCESGKEGVIRAYFYDDCYFRTSCKPFSFESRSKYVHLTNDAVQANCPDYGKYEEGNKLSIDHMKPFFNSLPPPKTDPNRTKDTFHGECAPDHNTLSWDRMQWSMRERAKEIVACSKDKLRNESRKQKTHRAEYGNMHVKTSRAIGNRADSHYFELYGLDFMIDDALKVWLIEVNTNPSITIDCSKLLQKLIPKMLDNALSIAVEPLMRTSNHAELQNKFQCIYEASCDY